ncbi:MAG: hypothetical protein GY768_09285 [Planctomycetaceae bacterium]|nr:hypothetical protein [Planctomycetaceae bacterium]
MTKRRRRYIVDQFQKSFVGRMVGYWTLYQFAIWNSVFCWQLIQNGTENPVAQYQQFCYQFWPMWACFVLIVPALIWDANKLYHRVAGPIFQFRKAVRKITFQQPVERITLRKGDELMDFQNEFNSMLDSLEKSGAVNFPGNTREKSSSGDSQEPRVSVVSYDSKSGEATHAARG